MKEQYARLENGVLIPAPATLSENGRVHYHPTREHYGARGYLPVVPMPYPAEEGDAVQYREAPEERDGVIVIGWVPYEPASVSEGSGAPTLDERVAAVESKVARLENSMSEEADNEV